MCPFCLVAGDTDGGEGSGLRERDLAGLAELEQREEGDGLLDPREAGDLAVEVEHAAAAKDRAEALEKLGDGRKAKGHVREGHLRRRDGQPFERRGELGGILVREPPLGTRRERCRAEAEVPLPLRLEPLAQPHGCLLHAPVLGQTARELLGGLLRLELGELGPLIGEELARLDLE